MNFAKQECLGLRVMAWRTLSKQVAQMERPLKNLYKKTRDLHVMSSHPCRDMNISVAMTPTTSSISRWTMAKTPMGMSVSLGLCSRLDMRTWKRRRTLLPEIPMLISEKKVFLMLVVVYSLLL